MRVWVCFAVVFCTASAQAATLLGNLDPTPPPNNGFLYEISQSQKAAIGFITPAAPTTIESVVLTLELFSADGLTLELRDAGPVNLFGTSTPAPGNNVVATFSAVAPVINTVTRQTYVPASPIALTPSTRYWLTLSGSGAEWNSELEAGQQLGDTPAGLFSFVNYSQMGQSGVWSEGPYHPGVEIVGVPEPAVIAMLPMALMMVRRRRAR
jgi:hypothetical protein